MVVCWNDGECPNDTQAVCAWQRASACALLKPSMHASGVAHAFGCAQGDTFSAWPACLLHWFARLLRLLHAMVLGVLCAAGNVRPEPALFGLCDRVLKVACFTIACVCVCVSVSWPAPRHACSYICSHEDKIILFFSYMCVCTVTKILLLIPFV